MKRETIIAIVFTAVVSITFASGGASVLPNSESVITEKTLLPLGIFSGGVIAVSTAAWTVSSKITRALMRLEDLDRRIRHLERKMK